MSERQQAQVAVCEHGVCPCRAVHAGAVLDLW